MKLEVEVEKALLIFHSFEQWVNKAQSWFPRLGISNAHYVCIDEKGRICNIGLHFMRARDEDAFPIVVYLVTPGLLKDRPSVGEERANGAGEAPHATN